MRNRLRSLLRDARGSVTIEMALVAPVLATMLIGMSEMARAYSVKVDLEQAVQRGIEYVQQGDATTAQANAIANEVASGANIASSAVTVNTYLDCIGGTTNQLITASCDSGTPARYIKITAVKYYTPLFTAATWSAKNTNGTITIKTSSAIRIQ